MQKQVYAIGSEAKPLLVEHGYAPSDFAERRLRHNELTEIGIRHSLFVTDIHARMMLLTRSGPITLAHWQEGSMLWDTVVPRRMIRRSRSDRMRILFWSTVNGQEEKINSIFFWKRTAQP